MKQYLLLFILCFLFAFSGSGQKKAYFSSGGEMIFSFANVDDKGNKFGSLMRWAPVFNIQTMYNADMNERFGLFTGLAIRNVGYIYDHYKAPGQATEYKKKFRSYNLALPVGIKIGDLSKTFFYAGYEIELPIVYKEKTFDDGDKIDKITGWFSNRQELFQHGFLAGIQFPHTVSLKFKYYVSEFHNQAYVDGLGNKPYAGLKSNIFYFSLSSLLFRDLKIETGSGQKYAGTVARGF